MALLIGKVNILIVDDQPEALLAMEAILETLGQNLVKASSGRQALWHLLRQDFAVILLDIQMPEMDGFETATLIRQRESLRRTPIIFLTAAYKSEEKIFSGYELGAVDYLFKPVVPEILRAKVGVFVELAKQRGMIKRQEELLREAEAREHRKQVEDAMAFSHAVSHDLRTPLRHIESFSELLLKTCRERLDEESSDYLNRLAAAAKKASRLVDALSKLAQATHADLRREMVDLSRLAAEIEAQLRVEEPERRVDFRIEKDMTAIGDAQLLRLVVTNLIQNAWKYTQKRRRAHIEFGRAVMEGVPVFFVRDNGAGFDMSQADKLFLPFHRLHPPEEFQGTGIGLATVQRVVDRHGGRIWGEGSVDQGATFFFTLPDSNAKPTEVPKSSGAAKVTPGDTQALV